MSARHGGRIFQEARSEGADFRRFLDFSANINPFIWPDDFASLLEKAEDRLLHYPEDRDPAFLAALSRYAQVDARQIIPGNGATELLYFLIRQLRPRRALLALPTFTENPRALRSAGVRTDTVSCLRGGPGNWRLEAGVLNLEAERRRHDLILLVHPNNPTGLLLPPDQLEQIVSSAAERRARVLVDESFIDFVPQASCRGLLDRYGNLLVLRSLTKFFSMPGVRLGYLLAARESAAELLSVREPWQVGPLAQIFACALLHRVPEQQRVRRLISQARRQLSAELADLQGFEVLPGCANFLLIRPPGKAAHLAAHLRRRRILVRCCSGWDGLPENCLRVAVRSPQDNRQLIAAIRSWTRSLRQS